MPRYRIQMINSQFESAEEADFASLDTAQKSAITTAITIVGDAVAEGEIASAVEIQIFEAEQLLVRQVITLSVTELTSSQ